ncbi:MAG TPA: DNA polymerase III subunit gamma/tau [Candidatus Paceibacterota bacterium]|nr:DNA polymerase III subunit gamma/tau [Candidatus Paceibacterota bacterium]
MSIALYRKYRPKNFKEVLGQDNIVRALSGSIDEDRIFHAYLFIGPRGTGKTSIARIFAKEIGTSEKDIYELDAASNTSVEDIREITDGARTLPFESKRKVYIIDEVHMLSKSAFNAFLKTLEEPPAHVMFILATTEAHKVPDTIVSRCQSFTFKKPSNEILKKAVERVAKGEGLTIDKSSADLLALLGDGSFRDTIGLFEQVSNISKDKKITIDDIESITGSPRGEVIHSLIKEILEKNLEAALVLLRKIAIKNIDMKIFLKMLLRDIRLVMLLKFAPEMEKEILSEVSDDEAKVFKELKGHKNIAVLPQALKELIYANHELGHGSIPELPIELALIRLLGQTN